MLKRIMTKTATRIFLTISLVATLSLGLSGCSLSSNTQPETTVTDSTPTDILKQNEGKENIGRPAEAEYSYVASASGQTALDLLKQNAEVQEKEFGFGTFIEGINGVLGDEKQYWAFYVNREYATEAVDKTILSEGDIATFRLEPVEAFPSPKSEE